jgi:hypothetical protein
VIVIEVKTVSEANRASHEHWRARQKRARLQRGVSALVCRAAQLKPELPCTLRLTRVSPSSGLDSDNLPTSCKHVRDGIADALGINDRDPRVTWTYAQRRGEPKRYAVEVEVIRERDAT